MMTRKFYFCLVFIDDHQLKPHDQYAMHFDPFFYDPYM